MKLKYTFVINEVAGQKVAVPINCGYGQQNIIKTNETGAYILNLLQNDISFEEILQKIKLDFEVETPENLELWLNNFIDQLKTADVLIYEQ